MVTKRGGDWTPAPTRGSVLMYGASVGDLPEDIALDGSNITYNILYINDLYRYLLPLWYFDLITISMRAQSFYRNSANQFAFIVTLSGGIVFISIWLRRPIMSSRVLAVIARYRVLAVLRAKI